MPQEHEILEVDVLYVGAGAATLASALHLQNLIQAHNERADAGGGQAHLDPMIAIIEKGSEVGAHSLSGAVLDPSALGELIPDHRARGCPVERVVDAEDVYFLTASKALRFPVTPPSMRNHGNYIISLARFNRWLGALVEASGVNIFPGFAGVEILEDGERVCGVRTGDKGIDKHGVKKANFEPGIDLRAGVTIFGDGPRGYLSKQLIERRGLLAGKSRQVFETGVKEIIELPDGRVDRGRVIHTMGYPFGNDAVGGTWIYYMADNLVSVGLVVPLDYGDPFLNPHELLQRFKDHPHIRGVLKGGRVTAYGAKVISAGGYRSIPKLYCDGAMIVGEAASLVDMARLKGIHLAMKSGMQAAETAYQALVRGDFTSRTLSAYEGAVHSGPVGRQMYTSRNFHGAMTTGIPGAFFHLGLQQLTGGRDILRHGEVGRDRDALSSVVAYYGSDRELPTPPRSDGNLHLDKLADVYLSGTMHNEDQPSHLKILDTNTCYDTCVAKFRYPCNRFCPANVYEMMTENDGDEMRLQVNFANCVHCQTCDIKCPLDNIRWTPPEGGDGPNYSLL